MTDLRLSGEPLFLPADTAKEPKISKTVISVSLQFAIMSQFFYTDLTEEMFLHKYITFRFID